MKKIGKNVSLELNEAYNKVLLWFFAYPKKEIGLSELAATVKISKTTANTIVKKLIKEGFLHKEELGRVWRISSTAKHPYNFSRKIAYNLMKIYESKIIDQIFKKIPNSLSITLFGSYRKGDDTEESDIDIAVEILGAKKMKIFELGKIQKLGYRKNVQVNLHIYSRNTVDLNVFANIANGIVLDGFLEVRP